MKILVADDETAMTRALAALLQREGYAVDVVDNGQDALDCALAAYYDALVLDIMMPKLDGLQVLTALREQGVSTPVLLLTAKSQVEDRVAGLTSGADDYLPKPFDPREFVARVGALTRRGSAYTPEVMTVGNTTLNRATLELSAKSCVRLSSKEFQMMDLLIRQKGRPISSEQFIEHLWPEDGSAEANTVWAYISYLRSKLEMIGSDAHIAVQPDKTYVLEADT